MSNIVIPVISVWQPWAWLLVHGHEHANGKRIENRRWPLPASMFGKWCLIHASKNPSFGSFAFGRECWAAQRCAEKGGYPQDLLEWWLPQSPKPGDEMRPFRFSGMFGGMFGAVKWDGNLHLASPGRENEWRGMARADDEPGGPDRLANDWQAWASGPECWITDDARPLPFVAWRGSQGFFNVPLSALPAEYRGIVDF